MRQNLKEQLIPHGVELIEAPDRTGALLFFQSKRPDLVIIGSPKKSPIEALNVAEQIRQWDKKVPIILISTDSSEEQVIAALRAGAKYYFKVPFSYEELLESVKR